MKRACSFLLAMCCLVPLPLKSQTMSHEEEVVRNAYAKLRFMCELVPLNDAAFYGSSPGVNDPRGTDQAALDAAIANACPVFSLTNFKTGPISEIANQPVRLFIPLPDTKQPILGVNQRAMSYTDRSGYKAAWVGADVHWNKSNSNGYQYSDDLSIGKAIQGQNELVWSDDKPPVTFTSYAAYIVDATFRGQSTGAHQALCLFGHDASGKAVIDLIDHFSGDGFFHRLQDVPAYPGGYLLSEQRDVPVVAAWVRSHEMPIASCSGAARALCCSQGRCGISQTDLNRDLSLPLPKAKSRGGGQ